MVCEVAQTLSLCNARYPSFGLEEVFKFLNLQAQKQNTRHRRVYQRIVGGRLPVRVDSGNQCQQHLCRAIIIDLASTGIFMTSTVVTEH